MSTFLLNPTSRQIRLIKSGLFVFALIPFVRLIVYGFLEKLGANPLEFITRSTGDWVLYFLCFTLAITPLRRLTKWNWLIKLRRTTGLFMFFYASLHFLTFLWFDHDFDLATMWKDVLKRPFIAVGFIAFVLLIPLALSSFNAAVRWLGGKRWQLLHRSIYLIAPLGILHFWWMKAGKHDFVQPILYGSIIAILLASRVVWKALQWRAARLPSTRS